MHTKEVQNQKSGTHHGCTEEGSLGPREEEVRGGLRVTVRGLRRASVEEAKVCAVPCHGAPQSLISLHARMHFIDVVTSTSKSLFWISFRARPYLKKSCAVPSGPAPNFPR